MEFKKYPIYKFSLNQKKNESDKFEHSSVQRIYKQELTEDEKMSEMDRWISAMKNYGWTVFEDINVEYIGEDSWVLVWFNHETIDEGQDDQYFLKSFEDYCYRVERENYNLEWNERQTLMGAEDRWRWSGSIYPEGWNDSMNYDLVTRTEAPCRCRFCKERGVVRINH